MKKYVLIEKYKQKKCSKCNMVLPATLDFFYKNTKKLLATNCKKCVKDYSKNNAKKYYTNPENKNKKLEYNKKYRIKNKTRIKERDKKYRETTSVKIRMKKYYENNREQCLKNSRKSENKKLKTDKLFKRKRRIKDLIRLSIKRGGFSKNSKTQKILGCTYEEFILYIENKFDTWMNWDNYGLYNGDINFGWDYDHIIPLDTAQNENDLIKLNHYTNIRPLCSYTNRYIKRNSINFKLT